MALPVWGLLEKSQVDSEKIEPAINRLIGEHNDNEESHLEAGQSLQSHKAAEIIDHLASSIVADKIKDFNVEQQKISQNKREIKTSFESLDGWESYGDGGVDMWLGTMRVRTSSVLNSYHHIYVPSEYFPIEFGINSPVFETVLVFSYSTSQVSYFGTGVPDEMFMGFKVLNATLYACRVVGAVEFLIQIPDVNITVRHSYRCSLKSGEFIKFYVDGVLKAEATSNLPDEWSPTIFEFYIKTTTNAIRDFIVAVARYFEDV